MLSKGKRRVAGRMLMDMAKYIAVIGIIGYTFTDKMTNQVGVFLAVAAIVAAVLGFYTIPPGD